MTAPVRIPGGGREPTRNDRHVARASCTNWRRYSRRGGAVASYRNARRRGRDPPVSSVVVRDRGRRCSSPACKAIRSGGASSKLTNERSGATSRATPPAAGDRAAGSASPCATTACSRRWPSLRARGAVMAAATADIHSNATSHEIGRVRARRARIMHEV